MRQRLTIYDFSKIMNSPDNLIVWDITRSKIENQNEIERVHFKWEWEEYSGYGDIYLENVKINIGNIWCRDSALNISSDSKRQANKHYSILYNEKQLINLFEYIINKYL